MAFERAAWCRLILRYLGDQSNCSIICTLFTIAFLGKSDERGECPFLWPFTSFPDRHTFCALCPVLSLLLLWISSARTSSGPVALRLAVCTNGTSNLWTKGWRLLLPILLFNSFPFLITVQVFTIPFSPVRDLCSFSQIFASCWQDTLQT